MYEFHKAILFYDDYHPHVNRNVVNWNVISSSHHSEVDIKVMSRIFRNLLLTCKYTFNDAMHFVSIEYYNVWNAINAIGALRQYNLFQIVCTQFARHSCSIRFGPSKIVSKLSSQIRCIPIQLEAGMQLGLNWLKYRELRPRSMHLYRLSLSGLFLESNQLIPVLDYRVAECGQSWVAVISVSDKWENIQGDECSSSLEWVRFISLLSDWLWTNTIDCRINFANRFLNTILA